jgi:hypothetical protein
MKTTFISLMALGVAAAIAGPADRALADEPMVLTDAQLDRVTAGAHVPGFEDQIDVLSWSWGMSQMVEGSLLVDPNLHQVLIRLSQPTELSLELPAVQRR